MPSSKPPKKKYRPKRVVQNPVEYVITGLRPPSEDKAVQVKLGYHWAMKNLTQGKGTLADWQSVCNAMNLTMVLAEMGWGQDYIEQIRDAMHGLAAMRDRYKDGKPLLFTGPELRDLNFALEIHDAQVGEVPVRDFEKAIDDAEARIARKEFLKPRHKEAA